MYNDARISTLSAYSPSFANEQSVVLAGKLRLSVLTSRLIRLEYSSQGCFEDRASQHVISRHFLYSGFQAHTQGDSLTLETEHLRLCVQDVNHPLSKDNLSILVKDTGKLWAPTSHDTENLGGTARTLDNCNGGCFMPENRPLPLSNSLISPSGWSLVDDSKTLVFDTDGQLASRMTEEKSCDWYFFGYGKDYKQALQDYYALTGKVPLLPKWALGLWWSRWESYTSEDLEKIAEDFAAHGVPLSVCVIDMDWHLKGWTGYTWNKDFFPDPVGFHKRMKERGVHTCLNLHPSKGVGNHEEAYPQMAKALGIDPESGEIVPFDIESPRYMEAYFKYLHHPREAEGVDFWWIDWQQGTKTRTEGLDPLWLLNHLHALDLARDGNKRPFIFSRWGGVGGHRYPIGFSGDTYSTWETLRFQPYFTATAANVGYGWWSHDIGGFARGTPDDELYTRWVQWGVWSPIFRLHNCGDPTLNYIPWSKNDPWKRITLTALKRRKSLLPYLYTCSWRNHTEGEQPILPLYHRHPDAEQAYLCPRQYYFGKDIIAAPATDPRNGDTQRTRVVIWLPEGQWCDFESGVSFEGNRWHAIHVAIEDTPVFAKAGALIPTDNNGVLELICFYGKNGEADFYDDDGESLAYEEGNFQHLRFEGSWTENTFTLHVKQPAGNLTSPRQGNLRLRGLAKNTLSRIDGVDTTTRVDGNDLIIENVSFNDKVSLTLHFNQNITTPPRRSKEGFWNLIAGFRMNAHFARRIKEELDIFWEKPESLARLSCDLTPSQRRCIHEYLFDNGADAERLPNGKQRIIIWHHSPEIPFEAYVSERKDYSYAEHTLNKEESEKLILIGGDNAWSHWSLHVHYGKDLHLDITPAVSPYMPTLG